MAGRAAAQLHGPHRTTPGSVTHIPRPGTVERVLGNCWGHVCGAKNDGRRTLDAKQLRSAHREMKGRQSMTLSAAPAAARHVAPSDGRTVRVLGNRVTYK